MNRCWREEFRTRAREEPVTGQNVRVDHPIGPGEKRLGGAASRFWKELEEEWLSNELSWALRTGMHETGKLCCGRRGGRRRLGASEPVNEFDRRPFEHR